MKFNPPDLDHCIEKLNARCGHAAFAAATGNMVGAIMSYFDARGGWVNVVQMETALVEAGYSYRKAWGWHDRAEPSIVMIQWLGAWMDVAHPGARCAYRHWVAMAGGLVWDINEPRWQPRMEWESVLLPRLLPRRATGHQPERRFIITGGRLSSLPRCA